MDDINTVNDVQGGNVDTQLVQGTGVQPGIADQKPVQSPQENAAFADMRRRLEATESKTSKLEKDYTIAKKYGSDYGVYSEDDIAARYGTANGIYTLEQLEAAIEQENQKKQYQESGYDPKVIKDFIKEQLSSDPDLKQGKEYLKKIQNADEKTTLQGKKFFKELEPEIDKVMKTNPNLSVTDVYTYLKGIRSDELYENAAKAAAGIAVENHINQAKRGTESADVPPAQQVTLDFTASEKTWADRGVSRGTYKDLKEAWEYLRGKKGVKTR